jgi:hypothetical protein
MITCNLMGGLGNQIFEIFATISYALKSHNNFKFLALDKLGEGATTIRYTYWNSFFSNLKPFLIHNLPNLHNCIKENGFHYNELDINKMVNKDIIISGYFQSYKYFEANYPIICRLIGLDKMKDTLLNKLNLQVKDLENYVSLHFRLGDYKKLQDYHPLATYEYYERSLNYIKKCKPNIDLNIMYFCEEEDIEDILIKINKLKEVFPNYNFNRGDKTLEDWEQMILMSCLNHNIIANSSFSWWGAYFNSWNDKIICYPSVWFGECANIDTKDLCPPEWIKIIV